MSEQTSEKTKRQLLLILLAGVALVGAVSAWRHISNVATNDRIARELGAFSTEKSDSVKTVLKYWEHRLITEDLYEVIIRDIGIALMITAILTWAIEQNLRNRARDERGRDVIEELFKRFVPERFFNQVKAHIIGANVVKEDWHIRMVLRPDEEHCGVGRDRYVSHTTLMYSLRSLSDGTVVVPVNVLLDQDLVSKWDDPVCRLPRIDSVKIGGKTYSRGDGVAANGRFTNLGTGFRGQGDIGKEKVQIVVDLTEIVRIPDTFVWSTQYLTDQARISIESSSIPKIGFEILALHPQAGNLEKQIEGEWVFNTAMLPWQGFQVRGFDKEEEAKRLEEAAEETRRLAQAASV